MIVTSGQTFDVGVTWLDSGTNQYVSGSDLFDSNNNVLEYMSGVTTVTAVNVSSDGTLYVNYGTASDTVVSSGGTFNDHGIASGTVVSSGGTLYVEYYGTANGTVVSSGGTLDISNYGTASDIVVSSGGIISGLTLNSGDTYTSNGYNISGTTIESGAIVAGLNVNSGGSTSGFVVSSGGTLYVGSGGTANGTVVSSGGTFTDFGTATDTVINNGGTFTDYGTASGTVGNSGGTLEIYYGGTATDTVINSGGTFYDYGTANGTVVSSGGTIDISNYGTASGTVVSNGGIISGLTLNNGDTYTSNGYDISGTTIENGAIVLGLFVSSGGLASDFVVSRGGTLEVGYGGTVSNTVVKHGGRMNVENGGNISGTIKGGGVLYFINYNYYYRYYVDIINAGVHIDTPNLSIIGYYTVTFNESLVYLGKIYEKWNSNIFVSQNNTLRLTGESVFYGMIEGTGTLSLAGGTDAFAPNSQLNVANIIISGGAIVSVGTVGSQNVRFKGNGGNLEIPKPAKFKATISGFTSGDTLDLTSFAFTVGETLAFTQTNSTKGTLTITNGSQNFSVTLLGQYSQAGFKEASDGHVGTSITYSPPASLKHAFQLVAHS